MTNRFWLAVTFTLAMSSVFVFTGCTDSIAADEAREQEVATPRPAPVAPAPKCELLLKMPKKVSAKRSGNAEIHITNLGTKAATLVMPGDGSSCNWRTPMIGWSAIPVSDKTAHPAKPTPFQGGRCGNINALRANEVFELKPGDSKKLNAWASFAFNRAPGKYRVVFFYTNKPDAKWQGLPLGKHDEEAMKRVKQSTPVSLISNEVEVEITP